MMPNGKYIYGIVDRNISDLRCDMTMLTQVLRHFYYHHYYYYSTTTTTTTTTTTIYYYYYF